MTLPPFGLRTIWMVAAILALSGAWGDGDAHAQDCPSESVHTGNLLLASQTDVDALASETLTVIDGNLRITGAGIDNLSSLSCLNKVTGDLRVEETENLPTLGELARLEVTGDGLVIRENAGLAKLDFGALSRVGAETGRDVVIMDNPRLESIASLERLRLAGSLTIRGNPVLGAVPEFSGLESLEDGLFLEDNAILQRIMLPTVQEIGIALNVRGHPRLRTIALPALLGVTDGEIWIDGNPALDQLDMEKLTRIDIGLYITRTPALRTLALPALETVARHFSVTSNERLEVIDAPNLENSEDLYVNIAENPSLERVLPMKVTLANGIRLARNDRLRSFLLPRVEASTASVLIEENAALVEVDLGKLRRIENDFTIFDNEELRDFKLGRVESIGGDLVVTQNKALPSCPFVTIAAKLGLRGYNNSSAVNTTVDISQNDDVGMADEIVVSTQSALEAFGGTRCVAGDVALTTGSFTSLASLNDLEAVAGEFALFEAGMPTDVDIAKLRFVGDYVSLTNVSNLERIRFPALERVSDMWLNPGNHRQFLAPKLTRVNRHLVAYQTNVLDTLDLPELRYVGYGHMILLNRALYNEEAAEVIHRATTRPRWLIHCDNIGGPSCQ